MLKVLKVSVNGQNLSWEKLSSGVSQGSVLGMKELPYEKRLRLINLPTLLYRRLRDDLIELYEITNNIYDRKATFMKLKAYEEQPYRLRGHTNTIERQASGISLRRQSFALRNIGMWNSLPANVVNSPNINCFKNRQDASMKNCKLIYNHRTNNL